MSLPLKRRNGAAARRPLAIAAALAVLAVCPGCVRESVSADAAEYHFKWWAWLWGVVPLGVAGLTLARHPSVWINGAWRPWWTFRGWAWIDLLRFFGCIAIALGMPLQTASRLKVDATGIDQWNALGLKPARTTPWGDVTRLDLTSGDNANLPLADRMKKAKRGDTPSMTAHRKVGDAENYYGWLVDAARREIIRRARAAGVVVIEAPAALGMPGAPAPMQPPAVAPPPVPQPPFGERPFPQRPFPPQRPARPDFGQRPGGG